MLRNSAGLVVLIVFLLTGCSGSNTPPTPVAPVFTSTPGTQAAEGSLYSYQVAASGTAVALSLSNAPAGATLSGNTLSWTPTAQQSRTANSFTVTARSSDGGSATQSWAVSPSGTVHVSWVDTYWSASGSTNKPFDFGPVSTFVAALVPQTDGSFQTLTGAAGPNGTFEIPNVPAGYYWLRIAPRAIYWTSSSAFDFGQDYFGTTNNPPLATPVTTYFSYSFTGLEPTATPSQIQVDGAEARLPPLLGSATADSPLYSSGLVVNGNIDYSPIKTAFVKQYEPATFGAVSGYTLGPALTLSNLDITNGGHNTISGALNPTVPASLNLSFKGSAWTALFNRAAPPAAATTPPTQITGAIVAPSRGGSFYLSVQPYIAADGPNVTGSSPIDLIWTNGNSSFTAFVTPNCPPIAALTADVDAGTVQYSDPYPATWRRTFQVCENSSVGITMPDGKVQGITLTNTQTTAPPTGPVQPLLGPPQNPKINGADLFTAGTVKATGVTLSWDPPAVGSPFGYSVGMMSPITLPDGSVTYSLSSATLSTAKTSMTVPPELLRSGVTYLFLITSMADGKANMETSPNRSALPTASAQLVSAPVTIAN